MTPKEAKKVSVEERLAALEAENQALRHRLDSTVADLSDEESIEPEAYIQPDPSRVFGLRDELWPWWPVIPRDTWRAKSLGYRPAVQDDFLDVPATKHDPGMSAVEAFEMATKHSALILGGHQLWVCNRADYERRERKRMRRGTARATDAKFLQATKDPGGGYAAVRGEHHGRRERR